MANRTRTHSHAPIGPTHEQIESMLYHYRAMVTAVHDGDTCTVDIDLGLETWRCGIPVRLCRINAPELAGPHRKKAQEAHTALQKLILGKTVLLQTVKDKREKYGRYLVEIWLDLEGQPALNVNDVMLGKFAELYQTARTRRSP